MLKMVVAADNTIRIITTVLLTKATVGAVIGNGCRRRNQSGGGGVFIVFKVIVVEALV